MNNHTSAARAITELSETVDALRAHCVWTQALTHQSLLHFLIEEAYEVVEAIETAPADGQPGAELRDELGDLLFQILLHARLAEERSSFDLAAVADGLNAKLIRRNTHIFNPDGTLRDSFPSSIPEIEALWEKAKKREKPDRISAVDGIPEHLPALARAHKMLSRAQRDSRQLTLPEQPASLPEFSDEAGLGELLLALTVKAHDAGLDPERALRSALRNVTSL